MLENQPVSLRQDRNLGKSTRTSKRKGFLLESVLSLFPTENSTTPAQSTTFTVKAADTELIFLSYTGSLC